MPTYPKPICMDCRHFHRDNQFALTCDAFPEQPGIPQPIITGDHDHRERWPGDGGIRFEPIEDEER